MKTEKKIILVPDWRSWFWSYLGSGLLIPLFGVGLPLLWLVHRQRRSTSYEVRDHSIRQKDRRGTIAMQLVQIDEIRVHRSWIDKRSGIGTLALLGGGVRLEMYGIENPESLARLIEEAAEAARRAAYPVRKVEHRKPEYEVPGTLDQLDYLTSMWQQGLLTHEEYLKEKEQFE